jgi:hypothetical protein
MGTKDKKSDDMNETQLPRLRLYFTAMVALAEVIHLMWEHFHGGVQSHHILQRADLPAFSNWWGLVLLTVPAWFLAGRIQKRIALVFNGKEALSKQTVKAVAGFVVSLLFGILLSVSFTRGDENITSVLFQGMLLLAVLLPVYRAECVLGFVLGMTSTFGAMIPTIVGSIIAAASAALHLVVYPMLVRLWNWVRHKRSPIT